LKISLEMHRKGVDHAGDVICFGKFFFVLEVDDLEDHLSHVTIDLTFLHKRADFTDDVVEMKPAFLTLTDDLT